MNNRSLRNGALVPLTLVLIASAAVFAGCGSSAATTTIPASPATTAAPTGSSATTAPADTTTTAAAGQAASAPTQSTYTDLAYADASASQKLDLYLPSTGIGPFPVVVAIHGGAFKMGDKADGQEAAMLAALDRGYAVASINYRLSNEATFPAQVNDTKAAVRYLRANAAKYNLDPNKIAAWGGSAGGYLAAMLGTTGGVADLEDVSQGNSDQSSAVQAVVDWFGPLSFLDMDPQFQASGTGPANHNDAGSPESQLLGSALPDVPALVKKADPTTYITADDPAFLIQHGTNDGNVPVEQSTNFADALTKVLGSDAVTLKLLEGAGHADRAFTTTENVTLVLDWLDAHLK